MVVAKRHGISEQTVYTWHKRFGGFQAARSDRLKQLEMENARVCRPVGGLLWICCGLVLLAEWRRLR
jgi:hypothetical protein